MRWFLGEMHRRYTLDNVLFLVDNAGHLDPILVEDGYRFQEILYRNRNTIERIFYEIKRRTLLFSNGFRHVTPDTAESGSKPSLSITIHAELNPMPY